MESYLDRLGPTGATRRRGEAAARRAAAPATR